ncbi:NADH dehydrogenase [ubiquinone] iron-sulfur protein 6, mitochondrial [Agrilus planipennis]|uniref:NADH dehydrogenase [ubiquinone] iron-sulfur protein 6, mitochondrial n=1 Tax=Agrilus planipennis TaxID=224129 RepID=A0A7F5RD66_AGRPL|nr:NADH dehydrogenase [ubiquinone] iron-sulfur protein 6, mitochondrial [Agrilus planipennis]
MFNVASFVNNLSKARQLSSQIIRKSSKWIPQEIETHTGQKWDSEDYRLVRFIDKKKHVNPNWAVSLVDQEPPKPSHERVVACDGGGGPTGHPKVFINLDQPGNHACGYCGLRFFLDHH